MLNPPRPSGITQKEWDLVLARLNQSPEEQYRDMVDRGVIDEQGNVLIRMPYLPSDFDDEDQDDDDKNC